MSLALFWLRTLSYVDVFYALLNVACSGNITLMFWTIPLLLAVLLDWLLWANVIHDTKYGADCSLGCATAELSIIKSTRCRWHFSCIHGIAHYLWMARARFWAAVGVSLLKDFCNEGQSFTIALQSKSSLLKHTTIVNVAHVHVLRQSGVYVQVFHLLTECIAYQTERSEHEGVLTCRIFARMYQSLCEGEKGAKLVLRIGLVRLKRRK